MNLRGRRSETSFYETVSDLMFATMAIFVMLMCVFLAQINIKTGLEELEEQIKQKQTELTQAKKQRQEAQAELKKLKDAKQAFESFNLELVIAVDTTGSMQLELDRLTAAISLIGKALPQIASQIKIGVIAYRRDEQNRLDIQRFPLQRIVDPNKDGKRSYRKLHSFVSQLKAQRGSAPLEQAMDEALKMFSRAPGFVGHQTFMLLGDVGPYEDRYRDQEISSKNRHQETTMKEQIKRWTKKSLNRNVLILFSGEDEIAKTSEPPYRGGPQNKKFLASREFFKALAASTGQEEAYSDNSSEMIPQLLKSAIK